MMRKTMILASVAALAFIVGVVPGCRAKTPNAPEAKAEHKAWHNGCLNAMGHCENGHAETRIEGQTLKLWFVGGGNDTNLAVRVPDKEFTLTVTLDGAAEPKTLLLTAKPSELSEEKEGDCSHFEGSADWLKDAKKFVATGSVTFKGRKQDIRIEYPEGYDPD